MKEKLLPWNTGSVLRKLKKLSESTQIYEIQKGRKRKTTHSNHPVKKRKQKGPF